MTDARELTDDFAYLTTTGRRTGQPHEIEIWYERVGDTVYLMAGAGRRSDWVANLAADPACTVRIQGTTHPAAARILDGDATREEEARARVLVFDKYEPRNPGLAGWRDAALPVALDLAPHPSGGAPRRAQA